MNTLYNYPIIGGIALGIKTTIDSIKYIIKKQALFAFPYIGALVGNILSIAILGISIFLLNWANYWGYINLPFNLDSLINIDPASLIVMDFRYPQNIFQILEKGVTQPIKFFAFFLLSTIQLYLRYYVLVGMAKYIDDNSKNLQPSVGKSLEFALSKHRLLLGIALIVSIIFTILSMSPILPIIQQLFFHVTSFYIAPIAAYESLTLKMLPKKIFTTISKAPIATLTLCLLFVSIDIPLILTKTITDILKRIIIVLVGYMQPVPQILLYREITRNRVRN